MQGTLRSPRKSYFLKAASEQNSNKWTTLHGFTEYVGALLLGARTRHINEAYRRLHAACFGIQHNATVSLFLNDVNVFWTTPRQGVPTFSRNDAREFISHPPAPRGEILCASSDTETSNEAVRSHETLALPATVVKSKSGRRSTQLPVELQRLTDPTHVRSLTASNTHTRPVGSR